MAAHRGGTAEEVAADPYAVERLLELVVQVAVDIPPMTFPVPFISFFCPGVHFNLPVRCTSISRF